MEFEDDLFPQTTLDQRNHNGKLLGDYYRNLANNYYYYSLDTDHPHKQPWPSKPRF